LIQLGNHSSATELNSG